MNPEIIQDTIATWRREPDKARNTPTVTARADAGQAAIQAGPFTWRADLPVPLGGTNQAPSPTALLLSALAGCAVVCATATAKLKRWGCSSTSFRISNRPVATRDQARVR
jgi:uncharacterized OsmC-like protein